MARRRPHMQYGIYSEGQHVRFWDTVDQREKTGVIRREPDREDGYYVISPDGGTHTTIELERNILGPVAAEAPGEVSEELREMLVHDIGDMGIWDEYGVDIDPDLIRQALPAFLATCRVAHEASEPAETGRRHLSSVSFDGYDR